jgi:Ankyrin repeat
VSIDQLVTAVLICIRKRQSWEALPPDTATFTPDITPLILAAHRDNYEIIKILLDRGAKLPTPHDVRFVLLFLLLQLQIHSIPPGLAGSLLKSHHGGHFFFFEATY